MRKFLIAAGTAIAAAGTMVAASPASAAGLMPVAENGSQATAFARAYPAQGKAWFDRAVGYVWGQPPAKPYAATTGCYRYFSYATFATAIKAGTVKSHCVHFDLESGKTWPSPANEEADPEKYMPEFNRLARAHGLFVIESPGADLSHTDTACTQPKPDGYTYYRNCRVAYWAALGGANIVLVQDQQATNDTAVYGAWFKDARSQAAGSGAAVFSSVSQSRGTASQCVKDVQAAGPIGGLDVMDDITASWEHAVLSGVG